MPEDEWSDIAAVAERHNRTPETVGGRTRRGNLPTRSEKASSAGTQATTTWVRVSDLNDTFGWTAHEEHVRRIRAAAPPLSDHQKRGIARVFLEHIQEREAKRRWADAEGGSV